jgi:hypothetical protein
MKNMTRVFFALIFTFNCYSQNLSQIIGSWDGGQAFAGEHSDSILLFQFDSINFHFQYGPNQFTEYKTFKISGDTLTLIKNDGFQDAAFRIDVLNDSTLEIQALNWTAVYITNTLCSPWTNAEPPNIPIDEDFNTQEVLEDEVLRTRLEFDRININ